MLVLSRKIGEKLVFYHQGKQVAELEINKVAGGRVSLAVTAPRDVSIKRSELIEREGERCQP